MIDPNLITTIRAGDLPPSAFSITDKIVHEVETDLKRGTIGELIAFISPLVSALQFEKKVLYVNTTYIANNFDVTGLGINLMTGFAICNGNNGTPNVDGLVGIGYGAINNVVGQFGGEKSHTLLINEMPSHSHTIKSNLISAGSGGGTLPNPAGTGTANTEVVGGGLPHNNMQPYIVELTVMKL